MKLKFVTTATPTAADHYQRYECKKHGYSVVGYEFKAKGPVIRQQVHFEAYHRSVNISNGQKYKSAKQAQRSCQKHFDTNRRQP